MKCFDALSKNAANPHQPCWIISSSNETIKEVIMEAPKTDKIEELIFYGKTVFVPNNSFLLERIKKLRERC